MARTASPCGENISTGWQPVPRILRWRILLIGAGLLLGTSLTLFGQSRDRDSRRDRETQSSASSYRDQYGVLSDRNIFLRDRRKPATTSPSSRPAEKPPEQTFMLTGVVYEPLEGNAFAYFEDLNANTILRVGVGEKVARGIVAGIDINAVSYEREGKQTSVLVGEDLTGEKASLGSSLSAAAVEAAPDGATSVPAIDPNNPNLTTEQRMRLRRQRERRQ